MTTTARWVGAAVLSGATLWAQAPANAVERFAADFVKEEARLAVSPFRMNRKQALGIFLPLAATTFALTFADADAAQYPEGRPTLRHTSQAISTIGAACALGGLTAGPIIAGKSRPMGRNGLLALADSFAANYALKLAFGRERPFQNDGQGGFWKAKDSFPSAHAMTTFAVAAAVAHSAGCPKWLKITAYGAAAAVSVSRWGAHQHFPSDILAGGTLGYLIGASVARHY